MFTYVFEIPKKFQMKIESPSEITKLSYGKN